ncbi:putative acyl-CoA dehydrogenase (plasmid) [Aromatoleum aromaticum EbN1]|uniref:Acyl-CoA dehydrogenase n=1 Tax=Aromatoleum aromaticum (strain DSM 19018 / LMG 30748 / EbN1) TaxID=76114 RepID=Q5NWN5_AROAE|nr:acyl-CoA dehydrogenase family protein [Aromatoleum aromaticum]CAI10529.1 putative acyl-CoA dehydrogenase [Aromatoleum aromaticum EbN1]
MTNLVSTFRYTQLPPAAEAFRLEIKAFLISAMDALPADVRARSWTGFDAEFSHKLAARGWVGITLPAEYGGANLDPFSRFVLVEELLAVGAPVSAHWIADRQSGPLILRYGTEAQRRFYLPRICGAKAFFCIGMSEPNAGSDLGSVGTRATRTEHGWRLNGRKIWTTNAVHCQYMLALVRTSGSPQDRQKGLSQVIVDLSLPGVTVRPIEDLTGDTHFSEVFFDDVELGDDALIGQEGNGWEQVTAELAFERSGPERLYSSLVLVDRWIDYLRQSGNGEAHARQIGRFVSHLTALRNMSVAVTSQLAHGASPVVEAALVKDLGTEFEQSIPASIEAAIAANPMLAVDAELYRTVAFLSQIAPTFSLRGGTREILRGVIARGLGLR